MLEVVQDQQHPLFTQVDRDGRDQRLSYGLTHAQRIGNRRDDERGICEWGERHERHTVGEDGCQSLCDRDGQPRFPRPSGSGQGE